MLKTIRNRSRVTERIEDHHHHGITHSCRSGEDHDCAPAQSSQSSKWRFSFTILSSTSIGNWPTPTTDHSPSLSLTSPTAFQSKSATSPLNLAYKKKKHILKAIISIYIFIQQHYVYISHGIIFKELRMVTSFSLLF